MIDLTGYKLTFSEEFNARSISKDGKGTTWSDIRSEWKYGENADIGFGKSSFVDPASGYDPFKVANGSLTITATKDPTTAGYPGSWESGLIHTKNSFAQTYGYFEIRADMSDSIGSWDAFWMLPMKPANNLPGWQELDIVEHYGSNDKGVYSWIHTTDPSSNPSLERHVYSNNPAITSGYHTYGMEWSADKISFYVDGVFKGSRVTPSDMHGPMYMIANLATTAEARGGPMSMSIDYIRAYSKDANAVAVSLGTVSAPDGKDPGVYGASSATHTSVPIWSSTAAETLPSGLVLSGTERNDKLFGGVGDDTLTGGEGRDELTGGAGRDRLFGGVGDDTIWADADDLVVDGGAGRDKVYFEGSKGAVLDLAKASVEEVDGSAGSDVFDGNGATVALKLFGRHGDDVLIGGSGRDEITGGTGKDKLYGGAGDDVIKADADDLVIDGGAGRDTLYFEGDQGAKIDLAKASVEEVHGSGGDDIFVGSGSAVSLKLHGKNGADTLIGGLGRDELNGGAGSDKIYAGVGSDILSGGADDDVFVFETLKAGNTALIKDFTSGQDSLGIDLDVFIGLPSTPEQMSSWFTSNRSGVAADSDDRIIFNMSTGVLSYDADGTGAQKAVAFARLEGGVSLAVADFDFFH